MPERKSECQERESRLSLALCSACQTGQVKPAGKVNSHCTKGSETATMSVRCKTRTNPRHFLFNWIRGFLSSAGRVVAGQSAQHTYANVVSETKVPPVTPLRMTRLFITFQPLIAATPRTITQQGAQGGIRGSRPFAFTCRRLLKMSGLLLALCRSWTSLQTMSTSPCTTAM